MKQWVSKCCTARPIGKIEGDDECQSAFGFCKDCGEKAVFIVSNPETMVGDVQFTPDNIKNLGHNEVLVFGSNTKGRHGKGLALVAFKQFGAVYGQGEGEFGKTYALPTRDGTPKIPVSLSIEQVALKVWKFIAHAVENQHKKYFVTKIGCGLAGFEVRQIAPLFFRHPLPKNVILPKEFHEHNK